jgi:hypothetical protein
MTQGKEPEQVPQPAPGGNLLSVPAVGLIVSGGLTGLVAVVELHGLIYDPLPPPGFHNFTFGIQMGQTPMASARAFDVLSILLTSLMIYGAFQMLLLRNYPFAMTAAVLAVIPLTALWCGCLTVPFGLWAMSLLLRRDVQYQFD